MKAINDLNAGNAEVICSFMYPINNNTLFYGIKQTFYHVNITVIRTDNDNIFNFNRKSLVVTTILRKICY